MTTVHLHIGEPKTGTTYVQALLFHNAEVLRQRGLLVPGTKLDHIRAGHDVLGRQRTAGTFDTSGAWDELAQTVSDSDAPAAVISMEQLTRARSGQVTRAVEAFGAGADVRVVITVRDVASVAPARWQESVQFRSSWKLQEYLDAVFGSAPRQTVPGKNFWSLHDTAATARRWAQHVGIEHVSVVTVPRPDASRDLLWQRFGDAVGVDVDGLEPAQHANESLGGASAEFLRRVNAAVDGSLREADQARLVRGFLGKTVLPQRRSRESRIGLPVGYADAAARHSRRIVRQLRDTQVRVVGELDELITPDRSDRFVTGALWSEAEVAAAGVAAVTALLEQNASLMRRGRRRGRPGDMNGADDADDADGVDGADAADGVEGVDGGEDPPLTT